MSGRLHDLGPAPPGLPSRSSPCKRDPDRASARRGVPPTLPGSPLGPESSSGRHRASSDLASSLRHRPCALHLRYDHPRPTQQWRPELDSGSRATRRNLQSQTDRAGGTEQAAMRPIVADIPVPPPHAPDRVWGPGGKPPAHGAPSCVRVSHATRHAGHASRLRRAARRFVLHELSPARPGGRRSDTASSKRHWRTTA